MTGTSTPAAQTGFVLLTSDDRSSGRFDTEPPADNVTFSASRP